MAIQRKARQRYGSGSANGSGKRQTIDTSDKHLKALELAKQHKTYQEIADELNYADRSGAYRAVQAGLREVFAPAANEYRALENERIDGLISGLYPQTQPKGQCSHCGRADREANPAAVNSIRMLMERRARMMGLDLQPDAPPFLPLLVIALPNRPARIIRNSDDLMNLTDDERASLVDLPAVIRQDPAFAQANWEEVLTFEGAAFELTTGGALVDAYTFATHPDFCGLDLTDKPMQRRILQEYMRAGSSFTEAVIICGMRSGKGTIGSVIAWYEMYQLLEMANPQRYYGLTPGQTISTVNIGPSEAQAKKQVFKHIRDRIQHGGRWFQELKLYLDRRMRDWETEQQIKLPKDLVMRSGNSRTAGNVGGTNRLVLFDEICKYKTSDGADNAQEVYTSLKATTATFGDHARVISISSPEWEQDYGMVLLCQAVEREDSPLGERCEGCAVRMQQPGYEPTDAASHARMYGLQMATWEANTGFTREQLWELENGASNPREFARNFGARPVGSSETYYPDPGRWDRQHTAALVADGVLKADPLRYPYDDKGALMDWWKPCCASKRFVHVDLGLTRDACGMAMAHQPIPGCMWYATIDGEPNPLARKVVVDICVQVKPPKARPGDAKGEISFERIRQRIRDWNERRKGEDGRGGFNVVRVTFDGFQSADSLQLLRKDGFRAEVLSVDRDLKAHDTLQELINTDQLAYGYHQVLIMEGKTVLLKNGRKVDHPSNGSKDCLDAVAGAALQAHKYGGRKTFIGG